MPESDPIQTDPNRKALSESEPWYAPGIRFNCTQCGNCCTGPQGFVWFDEAEAKAMAKEVGVSLEDFYQRYTVHHEGRKSLSEKRVGRDYDCVFLVRHSDGKKTCSVYESRPMQCRTWPFWESNLESPRHWQQAARTCPGMQLGGPETAVSQTAEQEIDTPSVKQPKGTFVPIQKIRVLLKQNPEGL